ncbi:hypothetical protein [uncultured Gimesia sp.]|uniref:hypothetical protein n=1 Tax=uncultured Gimesia sp. TaxID=1678688 RepID=UPI0030D6E91F
MASTVTLFGTLDFVGIGFVVGDLIVASSGELVFDLIAPGNIFDSLNVIGALTLSPGNTVTVDVGNPSLGLTDGTGLVPLVSASGGEMGTISNLQLQGDPMETAKIDAVFSDAAGILALI